MMKVKKILVMILIIVSIMLANRCYAANEAKVMILPTKNDFNKGEEFTVGVSVNNSGVEEGIYDVMGSLSYDKTKLELDVLDLDELNEEQKQTLAEVESLAGLLDILYVDQYCLIGGFQDGDSYLLTIVYIDEQKVVKYGTTEEMGKIKFKVSSSASAGNTEIKIKNCEVNQEFQVSDYSATINILGASAVGDDDEVYKPVEQPDDPVVEPDDLIVQPDEQVEQTGNDYEDPTNENDNEVVDEIIEAGSEDYFPYILILLIVALISYFQYEKYKGI